MRKLLIAAIALAGSSFALPASAAPMRHDPGVAAQDGGAIQQARHWRGHGWRHGWRRGGWRHRHHRHWM